MQCRDTVPQLSKGGNGSGHSGCHPCSSSSLSAARLAFPPRPLMAQGNVAHDAYQDPFVEALVARVRANQELEQDMAEDLHRGMVRYNR